MISIGASRALIEALGCSSLRIAGPQTSIFPSARQGLASLVASNEFVRQMPSEIQFLSELCKLDLFCVL